MIVVSHRCAGQSFPIFLRYCALDLGELEKYHLGEIF